MSTKIGQFEILSELAKSATGAVYKANDPQSSQTVALKVIQLSAFGEYAAELEKSLLEEAESAKILSNPNLVNVSGAEVIEGQFCAPMEYIQGNSVATMLARKEGFSIWDILDIGRQLCSGLDQAHAHKIPHFSLEPSKIMCGWDGTVRILSYGLSSVGRFTAQMPALPSILHYMSPEQIGGDEIDERSNLFSLGAIFYEMVTDQQAFQGEDSEALRLSILESQPVLPVQVNSKLHPQLSALIMKALAKDPGERYQNGRELLEDLEKCKESKAQAAKPAAPERAATPAAVTAKAQTKPGSASAASAAAPRTAMASAQAPVASSSAVSSASRPAQAKPQATPALNKPVEKKVAPPAPLAESAKPETSSARMAAAAAGTTPQLESSSQFITSCVKATIESAHETAASMSAALDTPATEPPEVRRPKITVDPMMAESGPSQGGTTSFSEMTELPPLKEVYVAPPPPPPAFEQTAYVAPDEEAEKPKIQPREVAEKAIKEIKSVPPRLMIYSIAAAAVLILIIAVALVLHVNNLNNDRDSPRSAASSNSSPASQPTAQSPAQSQPAPNAANPTAQFPAEAQPERTPVVVAHKGKNARKKATASADPMVVPGQLAIDSTPQGAQVQIDGKTDPSWVTPFTLSGVDAGQHNLVVTKPGYISDSRAVDVNSGSKAFVVSHLTLLVATLSVSSTPAGANVYIDGRDSGKLTPAQISVDKGQHVILVRKSGFIDETTSSQFVLGQTVSYSPALRALGNVDDIKTVGKMKKLFGGGTAQGMGTVSIRTQPKGAQIAVNQHMMEKNSPVEFMLDPGNYIVDITLSGYAPIHKIVNVDKGGRAVVDEVLQRQ